MFISRYKQTDRAKTRNPVALCCSRKRATLTSLLLREGGWVRVHGSGARLRFAGRSAPRRAPGAPRGAQRRGAAGQQPRDDPRGEQAKYPLLARAAGRPALWRWRPDEGQEAEQARRPEAGDPAAPAGPRERLEEARGVRRRGAAHRSRASSSEEAAGARHREAGKGRSRWSSSCSNWSIKCRG